MFSARTNRHTVGTLSSSRRQSSDSPLVPFPRRRAEGSTHTCWSWTAEGVHADASALKRITPSSTQSHDLPCSICVRVRQRKPSGSRLIGSSPSSCSWAAAQAGRSSSRSSGVAGRSRLSTDGGGSRMTNTGCPGRSSRARGRRERVASQSSETARASPISIRGADRATGLANAPQPRPEGTAFTPR
jgi:hypothetical protein